jgi:hypothetical protein
MEIYKTKAPNYSQKKTPKGFKLKSDLTPSPSAYSPDINKESKRSLSPRWEFTHTKKSSFLDAIQEQKKALPGPGSYKTTIDAYKLLSTSIKRSYK